MEEVFKNHAVVLELRAGGKVILTTDEHPFWVQGRGWTSAKDLMEGDRLRSHDGRWVVLNGTRRTSNEVLVYNLRIADYHTYFVGSREWGFSVWAHNACGGQAPHGAELEGEVSFGKNFDKKPRKHIDQVRNRGPVKEDFPSPGRGGTERVEEIIRLRVAQGGGRATTYAGEAAIAFEDGGVTYNFRLNGEFWTILVN